MSMMLFALQRSHHQEYLRLPQCKALFKITHNLFLEDRNMTYQRNKFRWKQFEIGFKKAQRIKPTLKYLGKQQLLGFIPKSQQIL